MGMSAGIFIGIAIGVFIGWHYYYLPLKAKNTKLKEYIEELLTKETTK